VEIQVPRSLDRERLLSPLAVGEWAGDRWEPLYTLDGGYRRRITRRSPLRFALVYLSRHLASDETGGVLSFSPMHVDMARAALTWNVVGGVRDAWIAPRGGTKSTWMLILVLWALAHRHRWFALLYSDTTDQIKIQMGDIRLELETNERLQLDFPHLIPARTGRRTTDSALTVIGRGGSAIAARGMDARSLGIKVAGNRPDLIWLDDLEPDEANYSDEARRKRLATIGQVILPMNERAAVAWSGTVTRYGSLLHAMVQSAAGVDDPEPWIAGAGWRVHHYPALTQSFAGETESERSIWPARWKTAWLQDLREREPSNFLLNYQGTPLPPGGEHWSSRSFRYRAWPVARRIVHVDPAVTVSERSDETAVCVVGDIAGRPGHHVVEYCRGRRVTGSGLRTWLVRLLRENPDIVTVVLEENAGGDWSETLTRPRVDGIDPWPAGVRLVLYRASEAKRDRLHTLEGRYERAEIWHTRVLPDLERQMIRYPHVAHDDLVDTIAGGVAYLRDPQHERYRLARVAA
jgi:phage terminase large subunit-like protein